MNFVQTGKCKDHENGKCPYWHKSRVRAYFGALMRDENVEDLLVSEYEGEDITDSEDEEYEPEEDDAWYQIASEEFLDEWGAQLEHIEQTANQESIGDLTDALVHYAHGGTAKSQRDKQKSFMPGRRNFKVDKERQKAIGKTRWHKPTGAMAQAEAPDQEAVPQTPEAMAVQTMQSQDSVWESVDNGPPTHEPTRTQTPEPEPPTMPENDAMEQHFDALHADAFRGAQEQTDAPQECADTVGAMDEGGEPTTDSVGLAQIPDPQNFNLF